MKKEFIRVRSAKDITICASLVTLGCVLVVLPTGTSVNVLGFFLIFAGLILGLTLKTAYKDVENGNKYCKKELFFAQSMREEIAKAIAAKPGSVNIKEENKGNGIRLDIYYNKATNKAYVQLFEYIPYKYEPCSGMYEYELTMVSEIIR